MTYEQAAQTALDVQNACNLSGVLFSFAEAMQAICDEAHKQGQGTAWKNEHPIVCLFLSKLADLNRQCFADYGLAQLACDAIAKKGPETE